MNNDKDGRPQETRTTKSRLIRTPTKETNDAGKMNKRPDEMGPTYRTSRKYMAHGHWRRAVSISMRKKSIFVVMRADLRLEFLSACQQADLVHSRRHTSSRCGTWSHNDRFRVYAVFHLLHEITTRVN
jgi:hypothetical protein